MRRKARSLPHEPGVYLMKDRLGSVLYVGKAKDLRKRVASYFTPSRAQRLAQPKIAAMVKLVFDVEVLTVRNETEAILLEGRLIKEWKPRYNTDFTDDKRFLLVRVDLANPFPAFRLARLRLDDGCLYFGPFANAGALRRTLAEMRLRLGILLGDTTPRPLGQEGRFRLYDDVRAELYGHPNELTPQEYRERVEAACAFLEGQTRTWLAEVESRMQEAAAKRDYERAASLRDTAQALRQTLTPARRFSRTLPTRADNAQAKLASLRETLNLPTLPEHIECFDISHISGTFVVASMVHFAQGRPDRPQYRRYQIRSVEGNDDFQAMHEVVSRRYTRLQRENKALPDLIVVDGGKGQVHAAVKAFLACDLPQPPLIGLAKREETIVFADSRPDLKLPSHHPGLHLLQHLRDEAHRHANAYNAALRSRRLRESVLDSFPGLGTKKKMALLRHFKSIEALRKAPVEALLAVEGIGPKTAAQLFAFLQGKAAPPDQDVAMKLPMNP